MTSDTTRRAYEVLLRKPGSTGLFLDFDGTLSDIVDRPEEARPVEGVVEVLRLLARRFAVVSVVSGRSARQLLEWLGPEVEAWGVHGAERSVGGDIRVAEHVEPFVERMAAVRVEAERELADGGPQGVLVEDKGSVVTLHYRTASDPAGARSAVERLADELVERHGLVRADGRMAIELRPPVELSKAQVVRDRARDARLSACAFMGDDLVDLAAFDALDELRGEGLSTVKVAVTSNEAPPELLARADVVLASPSEVVSFLQALTVEGD